ncbi:MAG TPA: glycosyltransferase, partial [Tepidiformaceae bacterium]|nr:glycosyltransferase [Tepidiformaceae bacterium]
MVRSIIVSSTGEEAEALLEAGPRRDFIELAKAADAEVVYRPAGRKRTGVWGRIAGAHMSQAWRAARDARRGDATLADGEHIGIPLALFLAARGKRRTVRLVMLGHFVSKRWKVAALRLASRAYPAATVLVHSVRQRDLVAPVLGGGWTVRTVPYHVDTRFWRRRCSAAHGARIVLAVGSEARDYGTLVEAARGIDAEVVIAAGSHWARSIAGVRDKPSNIRYLSEVLSFTQLRDLYERASLLVVPLQDVPNQSGVTAILEAMSMGLPVIVTATEGQRELVA